MNEEQKALHGLFCGRINVPTAAKYCGITTDQMKTRFKYYAINRQTEDWELDTIPCWPYA